MSDSFQTAYGLTLLGDELILAKSTRRAATVQLHAPLSGDEARAALAQAAEQVEAGRAAALAMAVPAEQTAVRRLTAPFASPRKAAKVWPALLDAELPFPVEAAQTAYTTPCVHDGRTSTWAAAIRNADVESFLSRCAEIGVRPTHGDAEPLALWAAQNMQVPPVRANASVILIWLAADHITIVRGQGGDLLASHILRVPPAELTPERWTGRMQQILSAQQTDTGEDVADIWWAGLEPAYALERFRASMPSGFSLRHEIHRQPAALLSLALARRAGEGTGVNFLQGGYTHPAVIRKTRLGGRNARLAVIAASLVLLLANSQLRHVYNLQDDALQTELSHLTQTITGEPPMKGLEPLQVERSLAKRDDETRAFRAALSSNPMELRLLQLVEALDGSGAELERLALQENHVQLNGTIPDIRSMEALAHRLRELNWEISADSPGTSPAGGLQLIVKGARHDQ